MLQGLPFRDLLTQFMTEQGHELALGLTLARQGLGDNNVLAAAMEDCRRGRLADEDKLRLDRQLRIGARTSWPICNTRIDSCFDSGESSGITGGVPAAPVLNGLPGTTALFWVGPGIQAIPGPSSTRAIRPIRPFMLLTPNLVKRSGVL